MSDNPQNPEQNPQNPNNSDNSAPWNDPARAEDAIRELREENRTRRLQYQELSQQFTGIQEQLGQLVQQLGGQNQDDVNPLDAVSQQVQSLQTQFLEQQEATRQATIQSIRLKVARELELPQGFESRLSGETEEEIREDAKALKALIPANQQTQQRRTTAVPGGQPSEDRAGYWRNRLYGKQKESSPDNQGLKLNI